MLSGSPEPGGCPSHPFGYEWRMTDSNRRPPPCKGGALPAELIPRLHSGDIHPARHLFHQLIERVQQVHLDRFELSTSRLSGVRSNRLSYRCPIIRSLKTKQEQQQWDIKSGWSCAMGDRLHGTLLV